MKEITDLRAVKSVALAYLLLPLQPQEPGSIDVNHPFTTTMVNIVQKDGESRVEYLEQGSEAYEKWVAEKKKYIDKCANAFAVFMLINKAYKYPFLKDIESALNKRDFSEIFSYAWVNTENPNTNPQISIRKSVSYFKKCDPEVLMDENELSVFKNLPETLTIYRGVIPYNQKNIKVLSWTLDETVAEWFAKRYEQAGQVYSATIEKKYVLAYFCSRKEDEVVVDPKYLQKIELHRQFVNENDE